MSLITIKSNIRNYNVKFGGIAEFLENIENEHRNTVYAIDENVLNIYGDTHLKAIDRKKIIVIPIHEDKKNLDSVQSLYDQFIERAAKKNITLVTIGGGIAQDITGFLASTLYRGVKWVFLPSTFLAQCDSCIGSKTSLNYKGYKNLIGTFYPPIEVCIDSEFLRTNKDSDYYSGVGEAVKLAIMGGEEKVDKMLFMFEAIKKKDRVVLLSVIESSLMIKKSYIEGDEFDTGKRNLLNYGHCFGHAIETTSDFEIPHGQAIVVGMILANLVSKNRGLLTHVFEEFIFEKLLLPSIVITIKHKHLLPESIIECMKKDKKRTGEGLPLVMLKDNYLLERVSDVTPQEIESAINEGKNKLKNIIKSA